jgi:hypothetical protein
MRTLSAESIRHGYTMDDLDRLARIAVRRAWAQSMDYSDRYDAAWHAIAELLYSTEAEHPPTAYDLKAAGARAVNRLAQDEGHHRGFDRGNPGAGFEGMPGFQRYWTLHRATPSPENAIVDRIALTQIWPTLSETHRQVLLSLAVHTDHPIAADAIDRNLATYRSHLKNARHAFRELWHEHETPSAMWGQSRGRQGRRTAAQTFANRLQQRARRARTEAA